MLRFVLVVLMVSSLIFAANPAVQKAADLYAQTGYKESLSAAPEKVTQKDATAYRLIGQDEYMLGDYKKSTEALEKAAALDPTNSEVFHWLGRAYGRRAETSSPFTAPGLASRARQALEKAVALDPNNKDAVTDLFDFYLQAPGLVGGGVDKAEKLVSLISSEDPAQGHFAQAQLDTKRKEYQTAEEHLRQAVEIAPQQVGLVLNLARFLAQRGRIEESDAMFQRAIAMAPNNPKVLYARAETFIEEHRNLDEARELLQRFLNSPLTANDPPRMKAEALLRKTGA